MSEEEWLCELCGYNSQSDQTCTHCGRKMEISYLDIDPTRAGPAWGRLIFRAREPDKAAALWQEFSLHWADSEIGIHEGLNSQLEKFNTTADTVEVYGAEWAYFRLSDLLGDRGTIEFQELPEEAMPHRRRPSLPIPPIPGPWRSVPRHWRHKG